MQPLVANLVTRNLQTYLVIVVMFTYGILLSRDFECTCRPQLYDCIMYAVLPAAVVTVLMLWSNRLFKRLCSHCCTFKGFICCQVLKSALVGFLWVAFLLIDGDWWACCFNNLPDQQTHLPCKEPAKRSVEEREIIAGIKNKSRVSGCWLLFIVIFSGAMVSWIRWKRDCSRQTAQFEETLYYKLVLEEEEKVLKAVLRESISKQLTAEIKKKHEENWKGCFGVAEIIISNERNQ